MLRISSEIENLVPYKPGQSIEQTRRDLGLSEIIKLASNENPLGPSPLAIKALQTAISELHRYPDAAAFDLTAVLSKKTHIPTHQILVGNGSNELIDLLIRTFCEPRESIVLVPAFSFVAYEVCAQAARVGVLKAPLVSGTPEFKVDIDGIISQVKHNPRIRMVFVPNPNNPTGTYLSKVEIETLVRELSGWDGLLVLDEAYLEFVRATDFVPALELFKQAPNVVVLHTFSKVYGLAGLRLGALYGPEWVLKYLHRVRNPFNVNTLAQVAAIAALADQEYIQKSQQLVWQGLDYFYEALTRLGLRYTLSQANFVLFETSGPAQIIFDKVLRAGIILRPVGNYGLPQHLRMSVGTMDENKKAIAALEKAIK